MGWSYGWGVLIGPIVGLVAVASAGDVRGAPTPAETLRDAAGELKAATDGALSEVHAVSSIDPSHSARPNIREYLLACRKKCDDFCDGVGSTESAWSHLNLHHGNQSGGGPT